MSNGIEHLKVPPKDWFTSPLSSATGKKGKSEKKLFFISIEVSGFGFIYIV